MGLLICGSLADQCPRLAAPLVGRPAPSPVARTISKEFKYDKSRSGRESTAGLVAPCCEGAGRSGADLERKASLELMILGAMSNEQHSRGEDDVVWIVHLADAPRRTI